MKITLSHQSQSYLADTAQGHDISRAIQFQENPQKESKAAAGSIPPASRQPLELDGFVGNVLQSGACNVDRLDLIPHCHGTHTETLAHLLQIPPATLAGSVDESVPLISDLFPLPLLSAVLITVETLSAKETADRYQPEFRDSDRILSAAAIDKAIGDVEGQVDVSSVDALIVRTDRRRYDFQSGPETPFLSNEAMQRIVDLGVDHFLLDLPSVDRLDDEGRLTNHRLFWNLEPNAVVATEGCWRQKTITEMVSIDPSLADGLYLLNLQVAPLVADAAPSRPVLFPLVRVK